MASYRAKPLLRTDDAAEAEERWITTFLIPPPGIALKLPPDWYRRSSGRRFGLPQ